MPQKKWLKWIEKWISSPLRARGKETQEQFLAGRKRIGFLKKKLNLDEQQAAASVGQIYLINNYKKAFNKKKVEISQVLLTLDDTIKNEKTTNSWLKK